MTLKELLTKDIQDIIKSPELSSFLLKTYSDLYMNGRQPRFCAKSQTNYFNELKVNGMEKIERTNVLKNKGIRYIPSIVKNGKTITVHQHINSENLTDAKAKELLDSGALKKSDFVVLPFAKTEVEDKVYTIDEVKAVMVENDYKNKIALGKDLGLCKGNIKEENLDQMLNDFIEENSNE